MIAARGVRKMTHALVVDDIATERMLAGGLFEQQSGWSVDYAENGHHALEQIRHCTPHVVVTDLIMPEMDGIELVESIVEEFPLVPVVLMTSQGSEEAAVRALEAGAASYVPKRCLTRDLLRIVERVVRAAGEEQSLNRLLGHISRSESAELANDLALLSSMVQHLSQSIAAFGICGPGQSTRVASAVDEALMNAYYHGNLELDSSLRDDDNQQFYEIAQQRCRDVEYSHRRIHVRSELSPDRAIVTIGDDGNGFNPDDLPDPTDPEQLCRPYGRGIMLMRTFMDDVQFNEKGNEVTLVIRRRH